MSLTLGVMYGIAGTLFFVICLAIMCFLFMHLNRQKFNKMIRIKNWTAGKPKVENFYAQLKKHKKLGDVYYVPALKKEDRQYIQYFGSEFEYPTNKSNISYVPVTYYGKQYTPEEYSPMEEQEREVIRLVDVKDEKTGKITKQFKKIKETVQMFIIKPTKSSMRQFNLNNDTLIKEEYQLGPTWWDKYGMMVLGMGMLLICMTVSILMIVFAYQYGIDVVGTKPEWIADLVGAIDSGQAPPVL